MLIRSNTNIASIKKNLRSRRSSLYPHGEAVENSPQYLSSTEDIESMVDKMWSTLQNPKSYNGNFSRFIYDLYEEENDARLRSSSQLKRIITPSRTDGGEHLNRAPLHQTARPNTAPERKYTSAFQSAEYFHGDDGEL